MTTEGRDGVSLEQGLTEVHEHANVDAVAVDSSQPLAGKESFVDGHNSALTTEASIDMQSFEKASEADASSNLGPIKIPVEEDKAPSLKNDLTAQQTVKGRDMVLELEAKIQVPSPMNNLENDSDQSGATEDDTERKTFEARNAFLEFQANIQCPTNKLDDDYYQSRAAEDDTQKETAKARDASLDSQANVQIPIPMSKLGNDSDESSATEDDSEMDTVLANPVLQNGKSSADRDGKIAFSLENHTASEDNTTGTPMNDEKGGGGCTTPVDGSNFSFPMDFLDGEDSGTEEEQSAFMKELDSFYKERSMEFKPPKFYGEGLNCLKLWKAVVKYGGYEQVTACKLWRQVGESFKPPKTCTTVSWTFRNFYEKALLEYEKHKVQSGGLKVPASVLSEPIGVDNQVGGKQTSSSGRARRDAAARAMQGWHSQRLLENGEVGDPIIKDKSSPSLVKRDKSLKSISSPKKRKSANLEHAVKVAKMNPINSQGDVVVADIGKPADWVKINVRKTKDSFEIYALVPGLLREEVQVQSDPTGRLIISGEPEQPDNPWGVTPFKKVITLPSRIDPHQTSAVVTLHGQLLVRAPFEQSDV